MLGGAGLSDAMYSIHSSHQPLIHTCKVGYQLPTVAATVLVRKQRPFSHLCSGFSIPIPGWRTPSEKRGESFVESVDQNFHCSTPYFSLDNKGKKENVKRKGKKGG